MQDKSVTMWHFHFLGQNFARFQYPFSKIERVNSQYAWTTSWGVSTRLIGALIMTHSDDNGLVLPPKIAPAHIAIIPIYRNEEEKDKVMSLAHKLK